MRPIGLMFSGVKAMVLGSIPSPKPATPEGRIVSLTTGRSIALERRGGVYILRMFIDDPAAQLPFHRQGD